MRLKNEKVRNIAMMLIAAFLGALGQLFFKYAFGPNVNLMFWLFMGFMAYVLSTFFFFTVLSKVHLSWAYGMGGLGYIFAVVLANVFLAEAIPIQRWIGVLVIFIGVVLIGMS